MRSERMLGGDMQLGPAELGDGEQARMQRVIVIGSGFAGLWAAISAAHMRQQLGRVTDVEILLLTRQPYHGIRVRFYETDLAGVTVPLATLLTPVGVEFRVGDVRRIDVNASSVVFADTDGETALTFDGLVLASGSALPALSFAGSGELFNVDTFEAATALAAHLVTLEVAGNSGAGQFTAVVIGGGFTGIEVASELLSRLRTRAAALGVGEAARVILVDHGAIGATLGLGPQPTIQAALASLGVECRPHASVAAIDPAGVELDNGERIAARTVVATAGMRASPLAAQISTPVDSFGRLEVDGFLRVPGVPACFAAGDVARAMVDENHASVMSCQHARPQGRIAGHNVVADLCGAPMIAYRQEAYVTVLDLGDWGALYMEGWERRVVAEGMAAKATKREINHRRIYPPLDADAAALFAAAVPVIQAVPAIGDISEADKKP